MMESNKFNCKKCDHSWHPRVWGEKPMVCPRCKSYDWHDDKEEKGNGKT